MALVWEALTATVCVLGLACFFWWLLGRLLRPLPERSACILLPGRGGGEGLEQTVRGFVWLRGLGLVKVPVVIADLGLDPEGREVALRLCARWPGVILWPAEELRDYFNCL